MNVQFEEEPVADNDHGAVRRYGARDVIADKNFRFLWAANGLFFGGQQIQLIATQWLTLTLTGSRTVLGLMTAIQGLAVLLASPAGGILAERTARRNLLMLGRLGLFVVTIIMGALVGFGVAQIWHLALAAIATGIFVAFTQPATQTFLYDLVGRERLMPAIAVNTSASSFTGMLGPVAGGMMIASIGVAGAFYGSAVGYFVGIFLMGMIPILGKTVGLEKANIVSDLVEVFNYIKGSKITLWLYGNSLVAFFGGMFFVMRPVYAREVLDVGAQGLGIMGLCFGMGSLVSVLLVTSIFNVKRKGMVLIISTIVWDVGMIGFAFSHSFPLTLAFEFMLGLVPPFWQSSIMTILQTTAPDRIRNRVVSTHFMIFQAMFLGHFMAGALADAFGDKFPLVFAAIARILVMLVMLVMAAPLKNYGRTDPMLDASGNNI